MSLLEAGDLVGRYRVEAFLAEGGMGRIYRALDTLLGRHVALKMVTGDQSPASPAVARLLREARAAAALSHPNICAVFDVGEIEGRPFIAMELVQGASLRALIGCGDVDLVQRLRWIHDLADALAAAHRAHLVHRDIKPDNVMVAGDGRVRLLDFGVVTSAGGNTDARATPGIAGAFRTQDGVIVGTVGYMAPEQAAGLAVDARTDQFAWGVLAYETLSGRHPFGGGHRFEDPPLLSERVPDLPFGVAAIVAKSLALDPALRFADMDEIVALLRPAVGVAAPTPPPGGEPGVAAPPALIERSGELAAAATQAMPPRRTARRLWLGASLVGATLITAAGVTRALRGPPEVAGGFALTVSHARRVTFGDGCDEFPSFTPDGRAVIYDGDDDAGNTVLYRLDLVEGAIPRVVGAHAEPGRDMHASVSPTGEHIAFVRSDRAGSSIMVAAIDGTGARSLGEPGMFPRWSGDGRAIWIHRGGAVGLYDATSGAAIRSLAVPPGMQVIWILGGADGPLVAQVTHARSAMPAGLVQFGADGRIGWQLRAELEPALALAPGGRHALASRQSVTGEAELIAVPLDGAPLISLAGTGIAARDGLDVSADGRAIAWSTCRPTARVSALDPAGAERNALLKEGSDAISLAGIPGSRDLLVVSGRTGRPTLWVMDASGQREPRQIEIGDRSPREIAVSPDGARFAMSVPGAGIAVGALRGSVDLHMLTDNPGDASPCFRKAGDAVVFTRPGAEAVDQVMIVPVDGGDPAPLLGPGTSDAAISPADDTIVFLAGAPGVPMRAGARGTGVRPLSPALAPASYRDVRFSPDGTRVLVLRGERELLEIDAVSGERVRSATAEPRDMLYSPSYLSSDGGAVPVTVRVRWQGSIYVADAAVGSARR